MAKNLLTYNLSTPLDGARIARIAIDNGDGNMIVDSLTGGEALLASGSLEYLEKQGLPAQSLTTKNGQAALTLKAGSGGGQTWFRLPWQSCNGATTWQIHLNPAVTTDVTAHSAGGNLKLDFSGMALTNLAADTSGGNVDAVLPENAGTLSVILQSGGGNVSAVVPENNGTLSLTLKSGAGNVTVSLPAGTAARIQATTGMGKVVVDPQFNKVDKFVYQSPDYDRAANKVDITAGSGAGNVIVSTK